MQKENRRAGPFVDEKYGFAGSANEPALGPVTVDEVAVAVHCGTVPFALNSGLTLSFYGSIDNPVRPGKTEVSSNEQSSLQ